MKKITLTLISFVALFASGCATDCIYPSGDAVEKKYEVEPFQDISIDCSADVVLKQSNEEVSEIVVSTAGNVHDLLNIHVEDGELIIDIEGCIINSDGVTVYIMIPRLSTLTIDGSGDFKTEGTFIQDDVIDLEIEGSGDIRLDLKADKVNATVDGSGDIKLKGEVTSLKALIDGSGDIRAYDCDFEKVDATIDGSGDVEVRVKKELTVLIDGSGDVKYKGDPEIESVIDGSGDLKKK